MCRLVDRRKRKGVACGSGSQTVALALAIAAPVMASDIPLGVTVEFDEIVTKAISVDAKDRRVVVEGVAGLRHISMSMMSFNTSPI